MSQPISYNQASRPLSRTFLNIGLRYLLRHPWQSFLMILGITLGVAVVVAIDIANSSASAAFDLSTDAVAGKTTHQITGGPEGLEDSVYVDLKRSGFEYPVAPVLAEYTSAPELGGMPLQLLGIDPFSEAPFRSYLASDAGQAPINSLTAFFTQPNSVLISTELANRYGLEACAALPLPGSEVPCRLTLEFDGIQKQVFIAGLLSPSDNLSRRGLDSLLLADIATAQELTGRIGQLTHIDLILPETASVAVQLQSKLPVGVQLQSAGARSGSLAEMSSAFTLNLTALSLLALVVGLFLIYNTMTFSVVQRRPVFGTLRCLGATREEIFALVVAEAFVVGLVGSGLGIVLGIGMGNATVSMVTQTINDLFFVLTVRDVPIPPVSLLKGIALGVLATTLTAAFPAWEAASVPPRMALSRSGLETKARRAVGLAAALGIGLIAAGGVLLLLPGENLIVGFAATFSVIIGFAMLTPLTTIVLMRGATPVLGRAWGLLGRMAPRDVVNTLSRTSIAVAALMVAVSVTIGVSLMVSSFRYTVQIWLAQTLQGDIYISAPSNTSATRATAAIQPAVLDALAAFPEIARVDVLRSVAVDTPESSGLGMVNIAATDNPTVASERLFLSKSLPDQKMQEALATGAVIVSEPLANRLDLPRQGGEIRLVTGQGEQTFPVIGIYYDYASVQGTVIMTLEVYRGYWNENEVNAIAIKLAPGQNPDEVTRTLQAALTPLQQLSIRPNQALRQEALEVFDRTFAITTALQILATVVAFIGVLSALLSLQLEKQRELGILRAVGLTGRQMRTLVLLETGLMGSVAAVLSMPTGFILALILIFIINQRAFGWTLQLQTSLPPFAQAIIIALAAALLAGIYPAIKMSQMVTAEALRGE